MMGPPPHSHTQSHTCISTHGPPHTHTHTCIYTHGPPHTHKRTMHLHTWAPTHTCTHTCITHMAPPHTHTHAYTHMGPPTHIHEHTHMPEQPGCCCWTQLRPQVRARGGLVLCGELHHHSSDIRYRVLHHQTSGTRYCIIRHSVPGTYPILLQQHEQAPRSQVPSYPHFSD